MSEIWRSGKELGDLDRERKSGREGEREGMSRRKVRQIGEVEGADLEEGRKSRRREREGMRRRER